MKNFGKKVLPKIFWVLLATMVAFGMYFIQKLSEGDENWLPVLILFLLFIFALANVFLKKQKIQKIINSLVED